MLLGPNTKDIVACNSCIVCDDASGVGYYHGLQVCKAMLLERFRTMPDIWLWV